MDKKLSRFETKIKKTNSCWLWTSAISINGYGVFWIGNGVSRYAHRIAYEIYKGKIPRELIVMHTCDNRLCVNPEHLRVGTNKDNSQDAVHKLRHAYGARNGGAKLSSEQVKEIDALYKTGEYTQRQLALMYGLGSKTSIGRIVRGSHWKIDREQRVHATAK